MSNNNEQQKERKSSSAASISSLNSKESYEFLKVFEMYSSCDDRTTCSQDTDADSYTNPKKMANDKLKREILPQIDEIDNSNDKDVDVMDVELSNDDSNTEMDSPVPVQDVENTGGDTRQNMELDDVLCTQKDPLLQEMDDRSEELVDANSAHMDSSMKEINDSVSINMDENIELVDDNIASCIEEIDDGASQNMGIKNDNYITNDFGNFITQAEVWEDTTVKDDDNNSTFSLSQSLPMSSEAVSNMQITDDKGIKETIEPFEIKSQNLEIDDTPIQKQTNELSYEEQRKQRIQRNTERLAALGFNKSSLKPTTKKIKDDTASVITPAPNRIASRLLLRQNRRIESLEDIISKYPHRCNEINQLHSILSPIPSNSSIFLTGGTGTGKSSILREYLDYIKTTSTCYTSYVRCNAYCNIRDILELSYFEITSSNICTLNDNTIKFDDDFDDDEMDQKFNKEHIDSLPNKSTDPTKTYLSKTCDSTWISKFHHALCTFFQKQKPIVILVLDDADCIQPRYALGQLLLYARDVVEYTLCIIVITKKRMLVESCIVNYHPFTFYGRINDCVNPISLHFSAYSFNAIRDIIALPATQRLVTKIRLKPSIQNQNNYNSMMETIIASMQSYTKNLMDIIQIAHKVWPKYMQLVNENITSEKVKPTLMTWIKEHLQDASSILYNGPARSSNEFTLPKKYILITAFLCQRNKAKLDLQFVQQTTSSATKRKRRKLIESNDTSSSSSKKSSSFTQERLFACCTNIVNLYFPEKEGETCKQDFLGSGYFGDTLQELIDMRMIRRVEPSETIRLDAANDKYVCTLDEDVAFQIADEIDFPLSNCLA